LEWDVRNHDVCIVSLLHLLGDGRQSLLVFVVQKILLFTDVLIHDDDFSTWKNFFVHLVFSVNSGIVISVIHKAVKFARLTVLVVWDFN